MKFVYEDRDEIINISEILNECGLDSIFFISGPPAMIRSFKKFLLEKKVREKNIITDDWE